MLKRTALLTNVGFPNDLVSRTLDSRCETCGDCFTKRYFLLSHAMTVHQVKMFLNVPGFNPQYSNNEVVIGPGKKYQYNMKIYIMSRQQPLKYRCSRCKRERYRMEMDEVNSLRHFSKNIMIFK